MEPVGWVGRWFRGWGGGTELCVSWVVVVRRVNLDVDEWKWADGGLIVSILFSYVMLIVLLPLGFESLECVALVTWAWEFITC